MTGQSPPPASPSPAKPRPTVLVHRDADLLCEAAAARLITRLVDAQATRGAATLVLTGGGVGIATLVALAGNPARDAVDWAAVELWWGDERFLPRGHPDRNETQARTALLDSLPLDPARVHPMPSSDGPDGDDVRAAAARHAGELEAAARLEGHERPVPTLDVVLLGVGPDGHVASLFPGHPALQEPGPDNEVVVGVRDSPKPPPMRVSLTLATLCAAAEVWLLAAGASKADAVARALRGARPLDVPAAGVGGRSRTLWLLDQAAGGRLSSSPASGAARRQ